MEQLHARYPFLGAAREAVEAAGVDLAGLVEAGGPPVERGVERARRALIEGTAAPDARWSTRAELLSYPVARVLVSLLDVPGAVEKYANAEADLAAARFREDVEGADLRSGRGGRLTLDRLLADFDLASAVTPADAGTGGAGGPTGPRDADDGPPDRFLVDVTAYLPLAAGLDGEGWRLVTRPLADGRVPVDRRELDALLREAVRRRVAGGLPLEVPDPVAAALADEVATLREALAEVDLAADLDTVVPGLFPPCMRALMTEAREGALGEMATHSRFSLVAFLASTGLDAAGVMELCGVSDPATAESVREQVARLRDDRAEFAPPGCATMEAYGDCVNKDDLCATISHPLAYYEERLDRAPREKVADWREA